jgi:hypothetical protein
MLSYFLISSLSLCLLYAVYGLFLRQETFFRLNRCFLLCAAMLSLLVPFFSGTSLFTGTSVTLVSEIGSRLSLEPVLQSLEPVMSIEPEAALEKLEPAKTILPIGNITSIKTSQIAYFQLLQSYWQEILFAMYGLGVAFHLFFFLKGLIKVYLLIFKNEKIKQGNYYLVNYKGDKGVFSFLHYLFWSKQIPDNELIKKHELSHIHQKHTLDILFFELLGIAFWCNPIIYFYQKSIRLVHEYLADEAVTAQLPAKTVYAHALVAQATQGTKLSLLHHFSQSKPLKQRIMKIYQEKSKPQARRKYWLALPAVALCLLVAAACQKQDFQDIEQRKAIVEKQEISAYIPQDFQEKMKELQRQYPNNRFHFYTREAKFLQKDLDESDEEVNYWERIVYHRPISAEEDAKFMEGEFYEYQQNLIREYGEDRERVQAHRKVMKPKPTSEPMTGYLYMHDISKDTGDNSWENEDNTIYTEVDEYPSPRDGAGFYAEMFKLVRFPEYIKKAKDIDLQGDMTLEMIVNKSGHLVKLNLIEGIAVEIPKQAEKTWFISIVKGKGAMPYEDFNGALFRAFSERSELRGWKVGIKNGKRVDTKIRFQIPLKMVKEALL